MQNGAAPVLGSSPAGGRGGWLRRARRGLARFARRSEGATAVEFALISVPFFGLIFAIFQISLVFLMQQGLRVALDNAARQVLLGKAQTNGAIASWQNFRDQLVCPTSGSLLPSFVACANIVVDIRNYSSFTALSPTQMSQSFLTDGSGPQYNPGQPCDIVVVRAIYPMPVYLPILMDATLGTGVSASTAGLTSYNGNLVQMLTAASVFRNEPYQTGPNTGPSGGCS